MKRLLWLLLLPLAFGQTSGNRINVLVFSATPTFDLTLGQIQKIVLTGNVTSSAFANGQSGQLFTVVVCQDSIGSRTFAWPTNTSGAQTVTSTANSCTAQAFSYDGQTFLSSGGGGVATLPPITGGNTSAGLFVTTCANWNGLLPPGNPTPLNICEWVKNASDNDSYAVFQTGSTVPTRDYLAFVDRTGNYRWLTGMNAAAPEGNGDFGNWILFDAVNGGHRILMQSKFDGTGGNTYLNSNGNWPVIINGYTGLDTNEGTGGFQVQYGGGLTPSTAISTNGSTGITTFNKAIVASDTVNAPIQANVPTSDTIPFLFATPGGATIKSAWFNFVSNSESTLGTETVNDFAVHTNGTDRLRVKSTGSLWQASNDTHCFTSAANLTTCDTSSSRVSAGVTGFGKADTVGDVTGSVQAAAYLTGTNCQLGGATGTTSPAACGSASAGSVAIPASQTSYTVNTTAVTANSHVFVQQITDNSGISTATCNSGAITPIQSARIAATSFTFTLTSVASVTCFQYWVVD